MARAHPTIHDSDAIAAINLSRLLQRLDQKLRSTDTTALERAKIAANLEYARQLLHKLESAGSAITVPVRRQKYLNDLGGQKQTIRRLNETLHLQQQQQAEDASDEDDDVAEETKAVAEEEDDDDYASLKKPKPHHTPASIAPTPTTAASISATPAPDPPLPEPSSALRNRQPKKSLHQQRSELFGTATGSQPADIGTEKLLDTHREEQDDITTDLLSMAKMLKESSLEFGRSLEDESGYLDAAKEGLDRNTAGLHKAGEKMDNLRKNENVSFIWSIIYMAIIVVLVFLTLFILFFAPKLRW